MKDNCYWNLRDAVKSAAEITGWDALYKNNAYKCTLDNLFDSADVHEELDGEDEYYCVGAGCEIGVTHNDGIDVDWLYLPYDKEDDDE